MFPNTTQAGWPYKAAVRRVPEHARRTKVVASRGGFSLVDQTSTSAEDPSFGMTRLLPSSSYYLLALRFDAGVVRSFAASPSTRSSASAVCGEAMHLEHGTLIPTLKPQITTVSWHHEHHAGGTLPLVFASRTHDASACPGVRECALRHHLDLQASCVCQQASITPSSGSLPSSACLSSY